MQALHTDTPYFNGEVLVTSNEKCQGQRRIRRHEHLRRHERTHPTQLAEGIGDATVNGQDKRAAHEIHSVLAWDAGDKAYAVIVDTEEGMDVDLVDVTDLKKPSSPPSTTLITCSRRSWQTLPQGHRRIFSSMQQPSAQSAARPLAALIAGHGGAVLAVLAAPGFTPITPHVHE